VSVYSEVDRGATFKLCLPRFEGVDSASEVSVCGLEPSKEKEGAVILAVDDNDDVRTAVVQQLRALGYIVHEADGAHAAWRLLDEHPKVDLLLTDIIMPGGHKRQGACLCRQAKVSSSQDSVYVWVSWRLAHKWSSPRRGRCLT